MTPLSHIRNFAIIAHIDHGKSTLADRLIQTCGGLEAREMREQVLDPMGMRDTSYVWLPAFESRMAAGYDGQEKRLDVQAAIGRRTLAIAEEWKTPLTDWRYEDASRAVPLINPQWPVLPLYMVPNAATSMLTTVRDYARFLSRVVAADGAPGLDLSPAGRRAMMSPYVRLNSALWWGLGNSIGRGWSGLVVAALWAVVCAVLALIGRGQLKSVRGLDRTTDSVKKIPTALKGHEEENV